MSVHSQASVLTGISLIISLSLVGCPDPEGQYDEFQKRRDEALTLVEQNAGDEAGESAGEAAGERAGEAAGERAGEAAGERAGESAGENAGNTEPAVIPAITSGTFLFGLAPNLNLDRPMTFVAEVEIEVESDGSAGRIISMILDPRTCEDRNVSAGNAVSFEPDMAAEIASNSYFSSDFGRQIVPGEANCISGSRIEAEIQLDGRVVNEETLCGEMNGMLFLPYEADLTGSTFGARRLAEGEDADISMLDVLKDCEGIDRYIGEE